MGTVVLAGVLVAGATLVALVTETVDSANRTAATGSFVMAGGMQVASALVAAWAEVRDRAQSRKPVILLWRC